MVAVSGKEGAADDKLVAADGKQVTAMAPPATLAGVVIGRAASRK